jgi:hypothetical protein
MTTRRASWAFTGATAAILGCVVFVSVEGCSSTDGRPDVAVQGFATGSALSGPCIEGTTNTCHLQTGRAGDVVNCFVGQQTCTGGTWGQCGASGGTIKSIDVSKLAASTVAAGSVGIQTFGDGTATPSAAACASNPCNADCQGIDVDAGALQPDGGFTQTTIVGTVIGFSSFPTAKTIAQSTPTCSVGPSPSSYKVCSYDYCCAASSAGSTTGTCQQWISSSSSTCQAASGADYTAGIGCEDASGSVHIPLCNRGATGSPSTGKLFVAGYPGSLNAAGSASVCSNLGSNPPEGCIVDLSLRPIAAGKCIDIHVANAAAGNIAGIKCASASDFSNGNRASMVNPPSPTSLPSALVAAYGASSYTQLGESDKCNNQSFVYTQFGSCATYGVQPPPPAATTSTYVATCLPGFRAQWSQFAYSTSVPAISEVIFAASTADSLSDGGVGTFSAPVTLADVKSSGGTDPAICSMSGSTTGCPKDLTALLGTTRSLQSVLQLSITEIATSALPTVNSWQVSYTCNAYE